MKKCAICILISLFVVKLQISVNGQNTGPSAPEAMSFEAPDMAEMVNPLTGDFVYVLPLLEVPGPQGGFPVTLSYHGGVPMDLEASWVGLGWNLNCGAINRNVQSTADDLDEAKVSTYYFNSGGDETNCSMGFGVGLGGGASIGANVNYSSSKGVDVSLSGKIGFSFGKDKMYSAGVGFSLGTNGASISPDFGWNNLGFDLGSLNTSQGFTFSPSLSMTATKVKNNSTETSKNHSTGITASANSVSANVDGVGVGLVSPSGGGSGDVTISDRTSVFIPIQYKAFYLSLGYDHYHWSVYKESNAVYSGSLYPELSRNVASTNWGFPDTYRGMDAMQIIPNANSAYELWYANPILPAFDSYNISGIGISGNITPMYLKTTNIMPLGNTLTYYYYNSYIDKAKRELRYHFNNWNGERLGDWQGSTSQFVQDPIHFYFEGEFSSYLEIISNDFAHEGTANDPIGNFNCSPSIDDQITLYGKAQTKTYNATLKRKYTGNIIEWLTNKDIAEGTNLDARGFIETPSMKDLTQNAGSFVRDLEVLPAQGIGAFVVTATDGRTYNYSLPVYQFEQFAKTRNATLSIDGKTVETTRADFNKYAYTWLLTSITGPDYIDLNSNGKTDPGDAGYWVRFDYGKWTDSYIWKFPFAMDTWEVSYNGDTLLKSISYGRKQVFYLDKIQTASHTAYFIKDLRKDGCGYTGAGFNHDWRQVGGNYKKYKPTGNTYFFEGEEYSGVNNLSFPLCILQRHHKVQHPEPISGYQSVVLKLKQIILVPNSCEELGIQSSPKLLPTSIIQNVLNKNRLTFIDGNNPNITCDFYNEKDCGTSLAYLSDNIYDVNDLESNPELLDAAIKIITLDHDYTLCPNTPNTTTDNTTKAKLTLKSVSFDYYDKHTQSIKPTIPPYLFRYEGMNAPYDKNQKDNWGFAKSDRDSYELDYIVFPSGSQLAIEHDDDDYSDMILTTKMNWINQFMLSYPYGYDNTQQQSYVPSTTFNPDYPVNEHISNGNEICITSLYLSKKTDEIIPTYKIALTNHIVSAVTANSIVYSPNLLNGILSQLTPGEELHEIKKSKIRVTEINNNNIYHKGGGLRVKSLTVKGWEDDSPAMKTCFDYLSPIDGQSSGITFYAPNPKHGDFKHPYQELLPGPSVFYRYFTKKEYNKKNQLITKTVMQFDLPEPATSVGEELNIPGFFWVQKTQNQTMHETWNTFYDGEKIHATRYLIHDNLKALGRVTKTSTYNYQNNLISETNITYKAPDNKQQGVFRESYLSRKCNRLWEESYVTQGEHWFLNTTSIIHYPTIVESTSSRTMNNRSITSVKEYDFLSGQPTVILSSNNNSYQKTVTLPAYYVYPDMGSKVDNSIFPNMLTQQAGSYQYVSDAVGNAVGLLGAEAQTWSSNSKSRKYLTDFQNVCYTNTAPPVGQTPIYRKEKSFVFSANTTNADGTLLYNNYATWIIDEPSEFPNWISQYNGGSIGPWVLSSQINCYNKYSQPIEIYDVNGNASATKMGYSETKIIGTASFANQSSFACSGFEERNEIQNFPLLRSWGGDIVSSENCSLIWSNDRFASGFNTRPGVEPHTGNCFCGIPPQEYGPGFTTRRPQFGNSKDFLITGETYRASVWIHANSPNEVFLVAHLTGNNCPTNSYIAIPKNAPQNLRIGDWIRLSLDIEVPANYSSSNTFGTGLKIYVWNNSTTQEAYIDDLRVNPITSTVNTYVFNSINDQLMAILDNENLAAFYEYAQDGSLAKTFRETGKNGGKILKISEHKHHFKREQ